MPSLEVSQVVLPPGGFLPTRLYAEVQGGFLRTLQTGMHGEKGGELADRFHVAAAARTSCGVVF